MCLTAIGKFEYRKWVVDQFLAGTSVAKLARTIPISKRTIYRWAARYSLDHYKGLHDGKRTGRPRKWTNEHAQWIAETVINQNPQQLQFEFALWTTTLVRIAFKEQFGLTLSRWTIWRIMRRLKLTPQKPKLRTHKYSRKAAEAWKNKEFQKIVKRAQQNKAVVIFVDESGLASQCVYGRTWGNKGETPIVRVANKKFRFNLLAAIGSDGRLHYQLREGRTDAKVFVAFLQQVQRESGRVIVIADNASIHTAGLVKEWVEEQKGEVEIEYLPTYSPELNPVEIVWSWVKRRVSRMTSKTKAQLRKNLQAVMEQLKAAPEQVKAFFKEQDCQYILEQEQAA